MNSLKDLGSSFICALIAATTCYLGLLYLGMINPPCPEPEFPEVDSTDLGYRVNYGIAQRHWRLCKEGLATSNDTCMKAFWYLRVPEDKARRHFRSEVSNEMKDIYEGVDPTVTTLDEFKANVFPKVEAYEIKRRLHRHQYRGGR